MYRGPGKCSAHVRILPRFFSSLPHLSQEDMDPITGLCAASREGMAALVFDLETILHEGSNCRNSIRMGAEPSICAHSKSTSLSYRYLEPRCSLWIRLSSVNSALNLKPSTRNPKPCFFKFFLARMPGACQYYSYLRALHGGQRAPL